ncbi:hypothetical protein ACQR10_28370 [Bradyrhizobium sp. HKCCYLRH2060]|uniref:hypothetical protein n=1 Tax=Bradyrhizobium sp. HKCCYLRH2060 TaxID=3420743 RepID=UPI003EBAC674
MPINAIGSVTTTSAAPAATALARTGSRSAVSTAGVPTASRIVISQVSITVAGEIITTTTYSDGTTGVTVSTAPPSTGLQTYTARGTLSGGRIAA